MSSKASHPWATGVRRWMGLVPVSLALALAGCGGGGGSGGGNTLREWWVSLVDSGGATTNRTFNQSSAGFDTPAENLEGEALEMHLTGDAEFERRFIRAPSVAFPLQDGLGPSFNNATCIGCHVRDGRANYTLTSLQNPSRWEKLGSDAGIFLRLSVDPAAGQGDCLPTAANQYCAPVPVPGFGNQLFHRSVTGFRPDSPFSGLADVYVRFEESEVRLGDGTVVKLSKPVFQIRNPYDAPAEVSGETASPRSRLLQADVATSPRMGMPVFGLGLLEAIPEKEILALADPDDRDGDGISGRPNWVFDQVKALQGDPEPRSLGRFGWKASTPSVLIQSAGAYRGDMGITNYVFGEESTAGFSVDQAYRREHPGDDGQASQGYEVSEAVMKAVVQYSSTLAVPARRNVDDPVVQRGAELFVSAKCSVCHHPAYVTGKMPDIWGPSGSVAVPEVSNQTILPFTDMLLHDMGEGLADNRQDFLANGREWKTRPLWGIGMTHTVNPLAGFLHDGRARTIEEAILWHGGEAEASQNTYRQMPKADREALLRFLNSL